VNLIPAVYVGAANVLYTYYGKTVVVPYSKNKKAALASGS
jgi:hypothetical protein